MIEFVRQRGGTPNFRRKLEGGERVNIVAFGTSMTADGEYLAAVPAAFGLWSSPCQLATLGLPNATSIEAIEHIERVASMRPDLCLVEFTVNDVRLFGPVHEMISFALMRTREVVHGTVRDCDFVHVYFEQRVRFPNHDLALSTHEAIAEQFATPSIDLEALSRGLVVADKATWTDGDQALTNDGVHHTSFAAKAVGVPFAYALIDVVRSS